MKTRALPCGFHGLSELMAYLFAIVGALERLRDVRHGFSQIPNQNIQISLTNPPLGEYLKDALNFAERTFRDFELDAAIDRIKRIQVKIDQDPAVSALAEDLRVIGEVAEDQLDRRYSVYVPLSKVNYYLKIADIFPNNLTLIFPGIATDIIEACSCYALDRNTACVFHCMGVLQHGLHSLAKELKVPFFDTLDLENWKNIIDQIEAEIKKLQDLKKGKEKDEKLTFYSNVAVQFRYFKDAWRNHVAHLREEYDADQAHSILIHVRDFIRYLSEPRLKELEAALNQAIAEKKGNSP